MIELDVTEPVDFSLLPALDYDGKRLLKELDYQIFKNPNWTYEDRRWFNSFRNRVINTFLGYEENIHESYMKGLEDARKMAGFDFYDTEDED